MPVIVPEMLSTSKKLKINHSFAEFVMLLASVLRTFNASVLGRMALPRMFVSPANSLRRNKGHAVGRFVACGGIVGMQLPDNSPPTWGYSPKRYCKADPRNDAAAIDDGCQGAGGSEAAESLGLSWV